MTRERVALVRREAERPRWTSAPRIGIVYSSENWAYVEALVNALRYELTEHYHFSPINIKLTQTESIHDIPLFVAHQHQRSDLVFALGVVFRHAPTFEPRLADAITQRIHAIPMPGRLPVFDCILVRDSEKQLDAHLAAVDDGMPAVWARRAIDTYAMMTKPAI
ncbi:hypothetical protein IWW55_004857 [Coemansia sp. RSA 2706]|nr:hypothetical protein LPJ63_002088 [Coemansia sp. RSA 2711]KAJ2297235.1 hypothetical protein IWW55_004857 [Coemansia sp. RSA 2706]KAJ2299480.1 hypothetical protein IWW54_006479 [Coemansia sp. RSA 2705]KAJ2309367.1 hypothetical protein IWW52_005708 [Coemansia sp. RSA 2704]KAJ2326348.1 hypothetical protein IWW51_002323 [Coemansia sp. RSA 2702]KAJ2711592.1 hypothetical protein H4R23_006340 [Coemansia sp. Cherry 401B]